jgi:hypothetical protein
LGFLLVKEISPVSGGRIFVFMHAVDCDLGGAQAQAVRGQPESSERSTAATRSCSREVSKDFAVKTPDPPLSNAHQYLPAARGFSTVTSFLWKSTLPIFWPLLFCDLRLID